jgi:FkbM family methyltransferase
MVPFPFVVNGTYSLGHWLKDYGYYPKSLPLCTYMDHGMTFFDKIPHHELENDAPLIFKFSPRLVDIYKKSSNKPVYNLMNPTIHYRMSHRIQKTSEAKGTLFFPGHSTPHIDDLTDWDGFIDQFNDIPAEFHPIDICLHPVDMIKGLDKAFMKRGYKVFCAGDSSYTQFVENFYNILKNYKYTMSNLLGSYTFYSVEMGIPFSLFGNEPKYMNKGDRNVEAGAYESFKQQPTYQKAKELFSGFFNTITEEQKYFVNYELGKLTTVSRTKASFLLYKALFLYLKKHPQHISYIKNAVSMHINERYKTGYRIIKKYYQKLTSPDKREKPLLTLSKLEKTVISNLYSYGVKETSLSGRKVKFLQPYWFLHNYQEIFEDHVYYFESDNKAPLIIDCGSNIGLSIIYFKTLFPQSKVIGFEPDPEIHGLLRSNLDAFKLKDIDARNEAVWIKDETLVFKKGYLEGHIVDADSNEKNTIQVKATRLRDLLSQFEEIDFLKIDIEGAELEVLEDCAEYLPRVKNLFIEFHNNGGRYLPELTRILSVLENKGFAYYMKEAYNFIKFPFSKETKANMKDLWNSQNIFAINMQQP